MPGNGSSAPFATCGMVPEACVWASVSPALRPHLRRPVGGWGEVAHRNVLDPVHEREIGDLVDPLGVGDAKNGLQVALGEQVVPLDALLEAGGAALPPWPATAYVTLLPTTTALTPTPRICRPTATSQGSKTWRHPDNSSEGGNAAEAQQAIRGDDGSGGSWFISANSATAERMIRDNPGRPTARTQAANLMLTVSGKGHPAPRAWGELPRAILRL
jgi:hypothetical protein